jgi:hypothetical protein
VIVVGDSQVVRLIEPNEPFVSRRPGVFLDRGRYLDLLDLEMAVTDGRLVWRKDVRP